MGDQQLTWPSLRAHIERTPTFIVGLLVLAAAVWFGSINVSNAANFAPQWSQDLAFFHQWVHSAANGGPWSSPLILEPQGFFAQVHTHFVLVPVVGLYKIWPEQELLLFLHSFFAALTIWPVYRLAEAIGGGRHALFCVAALTMFGPFQAVAIADFRPLVLLMPALVGVWYGAWRGSFSIVLGWSIIGLLGRQEAAYLLMLSGAALAIRPWGSARRSIALLVFGTGVVSWLIFYVMKPEMFFHFNPFAPSQPWPSSEELWANRAAFGMALLLSGWVLGVLSPLPLLAATPILWGFLSSTREWHALFGPGAHHHVLWLPFIIIAGVAGAHKLPKSIGPLILVLGSSIAFKEDVHRVGKTHLQQLVDQVPPSASVAADYDTIHRLSGRSTLWNVEHLYMADRPWHWRDPWPLTEHSVDWILMPSDHEIGQYVGAWQVVDSKGGHVLLRSP